MDDTVATMVGSPSSKAGKELKLLQKDIEVWNKEVLGRVELKTRQLMNKIRKGRGGEGVGGAGERE